MLKRRVVLKIFALLLILVFQIAPPAFNGEDVALSCAKPSERTLYVGGEGEGNYSKIQDAIDDASNGDRVFVYSGIYNESIILDKSIDLIGECKERTIIIAQGKDGINITVGEAVVYNFTIKDAISPYLGIMLYKTIKDIISHCDIYNNKDGIGLFFSHGNEILECSISTDGGGIMLWQSAFNKIKNCNVINTTNSMSLFGYLTYGNLITNNNFLNNRWDPVFVNSLHNWWFHNYWDNWNMSIPKAIFGVNFIWNVQIPWIQFDWMPALKPIEWWKK